MARRLGQGGMGEVFLAWDERLGRKVAIKRIRSDRSSAQDRERLRREAAAAARLSHPSVVQVYDLVETADGDAIILEYTEGRTLRELLAKGPLAPATAVRLAREVAEGLAAAHAAGLVHRDLKAENVMVTPEDRAKILDFGVAKDITGWEGESLTATGALVGTCYAMSPEQARGGQVDARSDLFSFGVLLFEMLAGYSPFRGANPVDTLRRVLEDQPPPLASVRPELPLALSGLVGRLLAKRREERPGDAGQVARELAAAASTLEAPGAEAPERGSSGIQSDLPTLVELSPDSPLAPLAARRSADWSSARARRLPLLLLAVLLAAVTLAGGGGLLRPDPQPVRVAVLFTRLPEESPEELELVASGLRTATLASLAALEHLAPVEVAEPVPAVPVEAARALAADEVLTLSLETQAPRLARVSLRRLQGGDGRVLWAGTFPIDPDAQDRNLRLLAEAVAAQLRRAYPGRRLSASIPVLDATDRDYADLLRIKARLYDGGVPQEADVERLEAILRGSPRFLEAHLLLAEVARSLFRSTRQAAYLDRAAQAAGDAVRLAPGDPRPLITRFHIALAASRTGEARVALDELVDIIPGDPQLYTLSGLLADLQGDLQRAITELTASVERVPSWSNLYTLADLEMRAGRTAAARGHLEELLARSPGNPYGQDRLGNLELLEGDPRRAEEIYLEMARRQPERSHYTNVGLARSLLGRHAEALEAYRQALGLAPGHVTVLLNLADTELALERPAAARDLYRRTLARLEEVEAAAGLSIMERMSKAQCLAHLGQAREAVALTQGALRTGGEDPEVLYAASLVYAIAGDRASALVNADLALEKGVQPRWFTLPAFGPLRQDPDLQAMLQHPPRGNARF